MENKNNNVYVKGENDKEFKTSDGFFRDPWTGEELTGNEERVNLGLRTPRIRDSKGNPIPISYKFWTKEEKRHYKETSGQGTSRSSTKNDELREKVLKLKKYLNEKLPNDPKINTLIDSILPPDPMVEKLTKSISNMTDEQKEILKKLLG